MTAENFPKDITEATISGIDVTPITGEPQPGRTPSGIPALPEIPAKAPEPADHAGIALLDIAIEESVKYCEAQNFPPPNLSLWQGFSRGFLNRALWHYFPEGAAPESPAVCALIGLAGLTACYVPVILAYYEQKRQEEEQAKKEEIAERNRKAAAIRAHRRANGQDANTGEPLTPHSIEPAKPAKPAREIPSPDPANPPEPASEIPPLPSWVTTNAIPVSAGRLDRAEPPAPGMT